jgi:hypothetical protein
VGASQSGGGRKGVCVGRCDYSRVLVGCIRNAAEIPLWGKEEEREPGLAARVGMSRLW